MVFPSVNPLYLDPPTWNQQLQQQQQQQILIQQQQQQQQQLQPAAAPSVGSDGGNPEPGPPRPNSMAERARAAKMPHPEQALRCPRCDSSNTKFCYFNNYSLSQPRHFCKACRRYWTRGGALRSVPVGGGTRRNKRSSKKPSSSSSNTTTTTTTTSAAPAADVTHGQLGVSSSSTTATSAGAATPPLFMTSVHHPMMDYGLSSGSNIGLGFSGLDPVEQQEQQWRVSSQIQQFPFLGGLGLDPHQGIHYPTSTANFGSQGGGAGRAAAAAVGHIGSDLISSQMASVKMEEQHARGGQRYNINSLGMNVINPRSDQFWSGGGSSGGGGSDGNNGGGNGGSGSGWMTNLSGFNSSSTGSLL